jgi:hypothetical protein
VPENCEAVNVTEPNDPEKTTSVILKCIHVRNPCKETTLVMFIQAHSRVLENTFQRSKKEGRGAGEERTGIIDATYGV